MDYNMAKACRPLAIATIVITLIFSQTSAIMFRDPSINPRTSQEYVLRGLGAEIVRTRTSADFDDPDSHIRVAEELKRRIGPTAHILNQYTNPYNPIEHFDQTAEEILRDCTETNGKIRINMLVVGAGTGGTVTGLSKKIKRIQPNCQIVGVDPEGSILATLTTETKTAYEVEGIGYDFIPTVLDRSGVEKWYKTTDREALLMARRLIQEEGLLCGGSGGAAVVAAIRAAKDFNLKKCDRLVVILPDSIRNYMTKFLSDAWMYSRGFIDFPKGMEFRSGWVSRRTTDMLMEIPKAVSIPANFTIKAAVEEMRLTGINRVVVVDENSNGAVGVFDGSALKSLLDGSATVTDTVTKVMNKGVRMLTDEVQLEEVGRKLFNETYIVIQSAKSYWIVDQDVFMQWTVRQL